MLKALAGSGFSTVSGLQALDLPEGSKDAFAKKVSSNLDSLSIDKINELLGTHYDADMSASRIKANNTEIDLKNKELAAEIKDLQSVTAESLRTDIEAARAKGLDYMDGAYIGEDIDISTLITNMMGETETRIREKQAQITANNSGRIDESMAVHLSMDDINTLVSKIGNHATEIFTIPDKIEITNPDGSVSSRDITPEERAHILDQNTQLIKDLRDMINTMSSDSARDLLREYEIPKNEKKEDKGDAKA